MAEFSVQRYGSFARENRAVKRYADAQSQRVRATISSYEQLTSLYARHQRREISADALLRERAAVFSKAARALALKPEDMNNVTIASDMTYSRHYPFLERVFDALGRDVGRTVGFFRRVDKLKPSRAAVLKRTGIAEEASVEFIRAYEAAVLDTIRKALSETAAAAL
jgi:ribosomal protein S17E